MTTEQQRPSRVVIVGASMAGLLTARVLSEHVDEVVVVERDRLVDLAEPRGRVPQGRHAHALLAGGLDRLQAWFPGIFEELLDHGAATVQGSDTWWHQAGGYRIRGDWGAPGVSMTRPLLEAVVRRRVVALSAVSLTESTQVRSVLLDRGHVTSGTASSSGESAVSGQFW